MNERETREKIGSARSELDAAESALEQVINQIQVAPRADKVAVSSAIEQALERLHAARVALDALDQLIAPAG